MKNKQREYKVIDFPPLTDEERATLERLAKLPENEIDFSDIPPSSPTGNGGFYYMQPSPKTDTIPKIDNDNLAWLKQAGKDYQAQLNKVLRWARMNDCPIATL